MTGLKIYDNADFLPDYWETGLFKDVSLYGRNFIKNIQSNINAKLSYYTAGTNGAHNGGILCGLKLRVIRHLPRMNTVICRYPLSLPTRGYAYAPDELAVSLRALRLRKEPLKIVICESKSVRGNIEDWTLKNGMPYAIFYNRYACFDEYLKNLTKDYRKSIKRSLGKFGPINIWEEKSFDYTEKHYRLYTDTVGNAKYKGFVMTFGFFSNICSDHVYLSAYLKGRLIGWILLLIDRDKIYAPICGFDLVMNKSYDIWRNLHIATIKKAIEMNATSIEFGDTAEVGKTSLGCKLEPRYLLIRHDNMLLNSLLRTTRWFEYKAPAAARTPFRRNIEDE